MLIPKYWAQYKQRFDSKTEFNKSPKQATIKRYGWSDISQEAALVHAKERVANAHSRWLAGEDIVRRERREEYNDNNGIPIREAIISEYGFSENGLILPTRYIPSLRICCTGRACACDPANNQLSAEKLCIIRLLCGRRERS